MGKEVGDSNIIISKLNAGEEDRKTFNQIKILFVSHESDIGGATISLINMIQGLRNYNNIDVWVLIPYKKWNKGRAFKLLESNGINYKEIWYRRNYKSISEKYSLKYYILDFLNMFSVKRIQKFIKQVKFDIICSNSTGVDVGARAAQIAKVPHIYYVREFMKADHNSEYRNKKRMKSLLETSDYVIFISKAIEGYYTTNYNLQNTIQFFDGFTLQDYYIKKHDILIEEEISFIQSGSFTDGKGTLNTIKMLYQLNQRGIKNWKMEFVGAGAKEYIQKMKNLISKYHLESQVVIGEFCMDMKTKLSQKDILIMNSRAEGFGRVTVEGMLAGCLVIGRYSSGTSEIIMNQINGIAFEREDEFINTIYRITVDREKYKRLARDGQKYAMKTFDCVNTATNFTRVVEECLR